MTTDFDQRAATWDNDPVKAARHAFADVIMRCRSARHARSGSCGTGLLGFARAVSASCAATPPTCSTYCAERSPRPALRNMTR
jgi:hypothetical protein